MDKICIFINQFIVTQIFGTSLTFLGPYVEKNCKLRWSFLVACYATVHPALLVRWSVSPSVRQSIGRSVRPSHFTLFGFLRSLASLLLPKWSSDLIFSPCPPARNWGSRVSGLVNVHVDFDHFSLFLAWFWTVMTPVSVSKALDEYVFPSSDLIDWDWLKNKNYE